MPNTNDNGVTDVLSERNLQTAMEALEHASEDGLMRMIESQQEMYRELARRIAHNYCEWHGTTGDFDWEDDDPWTICTQDITPKSELDLLSEKYSQQEDI